MYSPETDPALHHDFLPYQVREMMKAPAWNFLATAADDQLEAKVNAALTILAAQRERAIQNGLVTRKMLLGEYAARNDLENFFGAHPDVVAELRNRYGTLSLTQKMETAPGYFRCTDPERKKQE